MSGFPGVPSLCEIEDRIAKAVARGMRDAWAAGPPSADMQAGAEGAVRVGRVSLASAVTRQELLSANGRFLFVDGNGDERITLTFVLAGQRIERPALPYATYKIPYDKVLVTIPAEISGWAGNEILSVYGGLSEAAFTMFPQPYRRVSRYVTWTGQGGEGFTLETGAEWVLESIALHGVSDTGSAARKFFVKFNDNAGNPIAMYFGGVNSTFTANQIGSFLLTPHISFNTGETGGFGGITYFMGCQPCHKWHEKILTTPAGEHFEFDVGNSQVGDVYYAHGTFLYRGIRTSLS